jgi:hypothetical protein
LPDEVLFVTPHERAEVMRALRRWISSDTADRSRFDGVSQLIVSELETADVSDVQPVTGEDASLAGWLQESSTWDLVILQRETPVLSVSYSSVTRDAVEGGFDEQVNRMLGIAKDAQLAQMHDILPMSLRRAHLHLQELAPEEAGRQRSDDPQPSEQPVHANESIVLGADRFRQGAKRCERMRDSGLYHLVWVVGVTRDPFGFTEPSPALRWDRFASDLRSCLM